MTRPKPVEHLMAANQAAAPNEGTYPCPFKCPLGRVGAREWRLNPHGEGPNGETWCPGSNHVIPPAERRT